MGKSCPENAPASSVRSPDILPEKYDTKRVVLLPVEPGKVHVYWEFVFQQASFSGQDSCNPPFAGDDKRRTKTVLRFYDVTGSGSDRYFDLEVDAYSGNCYVDIPSPGGAYVVEFGFKAATGNFFPAMRSDVVETPPPAPATVVESMPEAGPETVAKENVIADFAVENDAAPEIAARNRKVVKAQLSRKLAAVSASANIKFLSAARKNGSSREDIRAGMDRLRQLTLLPDDDLPQPLKSQPLDLTELCEKHFLFGNSSK